MSDNFFLPGGIVDDDGDDVIAFGNPTNSVFSLGASLGQAGGVKDGGRSKSGIGLLTPSLLGGLGGEYYYPESRGVGGGGLGGLCSGWRGKTHGQCTESAREWREHI